MPLKADVFGNVKLTLRPNAQVEVFVQFFVGIYDHELEYVDDWRRVALAYLKSVFGFWFDSVTSIPWSFMDLHFYMVLSPDLPHSSRFRHTNRYRSWRESIQSTFTFENLTFEAAEKMM
jgi:hypothetical protein